MNNFSNEKWVVDWSEDTGKGVVINLRSDKKYFFSKNYGLPGLIPGYIREIAKQMIRGGF